MAGYDDGRVACTDDEVILRRYYPRRAKHISYQAIREVRQVPLATIGRRIQGSGDGVHWFNYDPGRARKDHALVIYLDAATRKRGLAEKLLMADEIRPVITPDDPDQVTAELAAHGVKITSDPEPTTKWWRVLSQRNRRLIIAAAVAEGSLKTAALIDLRRRPAGEIRGPKWVWAAAIVIVNSLGAVPLSYFAFGRRHPRSGPADQPSFRGPAG
jgi:hypothetical protein